MKVGSVDDGQSFLGWVLGGMATIVSILAGTVATLWKNSESKNAKAIASLEKRATDCEQDRNDLRVRIARLETQLDEAP